MLTSELSSLKEDLPKTLVSMGSYVIIMPDKNGYKEIVITGIHVCSYGKDLVNVSLIENEGKYTIDFDALEEFTYYVPNWTNMIKVPLLLYVMKGYYKLFIRKQSFN